ncbi:hypothetical protein PULV_b0069 [Pseudoalteromonas ulvae UL12]|uniref:Uncharacterized protein n=1 Tax=Pseudoalteromonas ulvae TaxID=107327 RepID=A0A244CQW7_PSEDV|nr:hypothetical protein [Pseudoalteromonas ulvae]MBE0365489.1 hypothetical protein [Pseudoalteromonas ulvae UL12]OUL58013.1 hypothetical protein B1199_06540 [Pseudoalteromonas ulvae]
MIKQFIFIGVFISFSTLAGENDVLKVERVVTEDLKIAFPNEKNTRAQASDFEIKNYVMMSNEKGERWAVLTLTNESTGTRTLEQYHLLATFADGERRSPNEFKLNFQGRETQSVTVNFGENKFPILTIQTEQ